MNNIKKLSSTTFSVPSPDQVIDIQVIQRKKDFANRQIARLQDEINGYDSILNQGKSVGLKIEEIKTE